MLHTFVCLLSYLLKSLFAMSFESVTVTSVVVVVAVVIVLHA